MTDPLAPFPQGPFGGAETSPEIEPDGPADPMRARILRAAAELLAQVEAETARIARLRRQTEAAELARLRLEAALDALLPTLPDAAAHTVRTRLVAARKAVRQDEARARTAPRAALLRLLAGWERASIRVGDAQTWLEENGHPVERTYAANALRALATEGIAHKLRRGLFRVNRAHPEMVALRLKLLEEEVSALDC